MLKPGFHIVVAVVWILWLTNNCCRDRPDFYLHDCCNSVVRLLYGYMETRPKPNISQRALGRGHAPLVFRKNGSFFTEL